MRLEPLADRVVADLFAGSGALGLEALSRGAAFVHFVEHDRNALEALRENVRELGVEARSKVWPLRLPGAMVRMRDALGVVDLVFLDPPYGGFEARRVLQGLGEAGCLAAGTQVVLERHAKDEVPEAAGTLALEDARQYGETVIQFYRAGEPGTGGRR